ncbi:MAG TPA: prepilin-type N-terminal cleavage/methylation domain-containing protein [Candidatus Sumerlaeota bacterium]|nr:prepilin-type N-terminal cleavage/methylation domain-containing protein [Candidatus Sumerlaeota bacterium]HOR28348.1 prepilin-type N-terminal cleavage/methylation domain-containing protein [Candidatus Sumerlaeota bacterium]
METRIGLLQRARRDRLAFTLIELLIVVAIIAILAAIAVPNFLEAQTRSKVARAQADLRSVKTALESYVVDNNEYPRALPIYSFLYLYTYCNFLRGYDRTNMRDIGAWELTTPIAYMTDLPLDTFTEHNRYGGGNLNRLGFAYVNFKSMAKNPFKGSFAYPDLPEAPALRLDWDAGAKRQTNYLLICAGPDYESNFPWIVNNGQWTMLQAMTEEPRPSGIAEVARLITYDPTNGTVSTGDIYVAQ